MKYFNYHFCFLIIAVFLCGNPSFAQNQKSTGKVPKYLLDKYQEAAQKKNMDEKLRLGAEIEKYLEPCVPPPEGTYEPTVPITEEQPPFSPDWYASDVMVHSGDVAHYEGHRQIDLKAGRDGWLYLAVNRRNVTGFNGAISIYKSSNGGATWQLITTFVNQTTYFGGISMLVEKTSPITDDSVRVLVFLNASTNSNMNDSYLELVSVRRNNTGAYSNVIISTLSGYKWLYVTACSDGAYYTVGTTVHVIAGRAPNAGACVYLAHLRSQNFGISFSGYGQSLPVENRYFTATFQWHVTGIPSIPNQIWVACEKRTTSSTYNIVILKLDEIPSSSSDPINLTNAPTNVKYEKPCITIQQTYSGEPRKVLLTYTKDSRAEYAVSTNTGSSWNIDLFLGTNGQVYYTWCCSDTLSSGGNYAVECSQNQSCDSITVRKGDISSGSGIYFYKRNTNTSSAYVSPVCTIYRVGNTKYPALAYVGNGTANVYFNEEHLVTGISQTNETPVKFGLMQNYPNPFNPETIISFVIPKTSFVNISVFDILGRNVQILMNEELNAGIHSINWNAANFTNGVYFYRIEAGDFTKTKKMILIK
jgi:hypothetical protein